MLDREIVAYGTRRISEHDDDVHVVRHHDIHIDQNSLILRMQSPNYLDHEASGIVQD